MSVQVDGRIIEEYVQGMAARLVGPAKAKADLLAEARDGLVDAAEAHVRAGLAAEPAAHRALAEFGAYRSVLPGYQAELAASQGRRTATLVVVTMLGTHLFSDLMWQGSPWSASGPEPASGYLLAARALDGLTGTSVVVALLALVGYGWGSRMGLGRLRPGATLLTRLVGIGILALVAAQVVLGTVVFVWSVHTWDAALTWPPMLIGAIVVTAVFTAAVRSAARCLRTSRVLTPAAADPAPAAV